MQRDWRGRESLAERDEPKREKITDSYKKSLRNRQTRRGRAHRRAKQSWDRVSLSQSHKSLLSALIVATRHRAVKHMSTVVEKAQGGGIS